ncbi:hypothetical protein ACL1A3_05675 [Corynebacterium striatum]
MATTLSSSLATIELRGGSPGSAGVWEVRKQDVEKLVGVRRARQVEAFADPVVRPRAKGLPDGGTMDAPDNRAVHKSPGLIYGYRKFSGWFPQLGRN